ncbi:hypothetical protein PPL_01335 [Heterostelium album PN500]|uniref:Uncharacterized protein n=1 Tax=Heterostelium pallidum (strain ATCC 26659 / Pp 5 / PN500) TaxID=670386 RepID=D3AYS1_HETP5|nr:hypothetical protein PPL_01335 [Heterostelium album PN500]EFA86098.1 hypothetical protein PPL_01335 [Heterostelium album PN500]|eukprot:XP_020438204.1 hypothetical protein PPL_01335 [Heterostelium album PN500]
MKLWRFSVSTTSSTNKKISLMRCSCYSLTTTPNICVNFLNTTRQMPMDILQNSPLKYRRCIISNSVPDTILSRCLGNTMYNNFLVLLIVNNEDHKLC